MRLRATLLALAILLVPPASAARAQAPAATGQRSATSAAFAIAREEISTGQSVVSVSRGMVVSGGAVTLTLRGRDQFGNRLTAGGSTVVFTAGAGASTGTIDPSPATDHADGTYTATFTAVTAGTPTTIGATIGGAAVTSTLPTVTVRPGTATQLELTTQPSIAAASGVALAQQPVVQLRDAAGNAVRRAGAVVRAAIATGGGTLGGTVTARTNVGGVASFTNLRVTGTVAGDRTLRFSATGLTEVTSTAIAVTVGATGEPPPAEQPSSAQTPDSLLARGLSAYQDVDYDSAAAILRAALAQPGPPALSAADRVRALAYLGATELFRERRDSAAAAFGRLLLADPRYRPDQLVFPPEVSSLFQEVRLTTRSVAVSAPPLTEIRAAGDRLIVWLYATSYHPIEVAVLRANGVLLRNLYSGGAGDSLQVLWDGRTATGTPAESGLYVLRVDSRGSDGRVARSVDLPLDLVQLHGDTVPLPPRPAEALLRPETSPGGSGVRALATGLAAAAIVVVLPSLVSGGSAGMGERFAVAGALGVAGVAGLQVQRRPQPIPANVAANQALRLAWQRQADAVRAENAARRQEVRLVIRADAPRAVDAP